MKKIVFAALAILLSSHSIAQKKELILATYTYSTNNRLQNLEPLAGYLSQQTGLSIKAVSYPTVQALIAAIKNDSVDFAMMNTSGYLVLQKNNPGIVTPLVNLDMGNELFTNYAGCIIALKQSGISSIKELANAGKKYSLALVTASSTSGNLVPRLLLNDAGIADPAQKFTVSYSGTHKKVVEDVLGGKADIGGCGCAEVDSARKNQQFDDKAYVITSFNDIPLGPVVYNKKTGAAVVKKIATLLKKVHTTNPAVFSNFCNGWTEFKQAKRFKPVADKDYDRFRKMFGSNEALWALIQ